MHCKEGFGVQRTKDIFSYISFQGAYSFDFECSPKVSMLQAWSHSIKLVGSNGILRDVVLQGQGCTLEVYIGT